MTFDKDLPAQALKKGTYLKGCASPSCLPCCTHRRDTIRNNRSACAMEHNCFPHLSATQLSVWLPALLPPPPPTVLGGTTPLCNIERESKSLHLSCTNAQHLKASSNNSAAVTGFVDNHRLAQNTQVAWNFCWLVGVITHLLNIPRI